MSDVLPEALRTSVIEPRVARREILARFVALAGPVTVREVRERYAWPEHWIEARLTEWQRTGKLVRGRFRREEAEPEWCSRKVAELARRRALAALRKQIEAVDLATFASFLQRWQHVDPRDRLDGAGGLEVVLHQLFGLPRPSEGWERDYLPARLRRYDPAWLAQLAASGQVVWAGDARADASSGAIALASVRFFARGDGALWMPEESALPLSDAALAVRDALARFGASFIADLQAATGLGAVAVRDALRELTAAGLVTNDTVEALREVIRLRALPRTPARGAGGSDPTRWLPADFTPSPGRPVVQRPPNIRRLPKWRRPDLPGPASGWVGRWSLLRPEHGAPGGTWGHRRPEEEHGEAIARQWLERYGVVTRDWWRRERPPVSWRAIYRELRRLEYRGEVRRGYFVAGLSGAQFALPDAVERLRAAREDPRDAHWRDAHQGNIPFVVLAASDPANPYSLPLDAVTRSTQKGQELSRPRGTGALVVTRGGGVVMSVEARGRRVVVAPDLSDDDVTAAARALGDYLSADTPLTRRKREPRVETIDGMPATLSPRLDSFTRAGWRRGVDALRYYG